MTLLNSSELGTVHSGDVLFEYETNPRVEYWTKILVTLLAANAQSIVVVTFQLVVFSVSPTISYVGNLVSLVSILLLSKHEHNHDATSHDLN